MHQKDKISVGLDTGVKNCMIKVQLLQKKQQKNFKSTLTSQNSKTQCLYLELELT